MNVPKYYFQNKTYFILLKNDEDIDQFSTQHINSIQMCECKLHHSHKHIRLVTTHYKMINAVMKTIYAYLN